MAVYAEKTSVPVERSRAEIETILNRYGATSFAYASMPGRAMIGFQVSGRSLRFELPLPDREPFKYRMLRGRKVLRNDVVEENRAWEQACRQRWRALALAIKAKLEVVEVGISTFEQEFLAHIQLPDGRLVGQVMIPQIERAYQSGDMPPLLEFRDG